MSSNFANRVKLLMEYDTSLTSVENMSKIVNEDVILEQYLAPLIRSGFSGTFDDILRGVKGGLKNTKNIAIKNLDDLITNVEKGLVSPATMGQIRRGLLKTGKITPALQSQLIDDLLQVPGVIYKGGNTLKSVKDSYKMLGYSDEVADEIAKKVMKLRKAGGIKPVTAATTSTTKITYSQKVMNKAKEIWQRGGKWETFKKYALMIGIPLAIAALIWASVSGEEVVDPEVDNTDNGGTSGGRFRDCNSSQFLSMGCKSEKIKELQTCIGFTGKDIDGFWGDKTQSRMVVLGLATGILVSDIESICATYNKLKKGDQGNLEDSRKKLQDRESINYFPGEEPYADYDTESTPSTQPSGTSSTEGPTAEY